MIRLALGVATLMTGLTMMSKRPEMEVDTLVRRGNEAFHQKEYASAISYYEAAQARAWDPGLIAFNLATAYYHLAEKGELSHLPSAEIAYRCCLERGDPRRAQALFGLGNCLLLRGSVEKLEPASLRAAMDRYTECLNEPGCPEELAERARYNQQRARLLLLQAPFTTEGRAESETHGEDSSQEREDPSPMRRERGQPEGEPEPTSASEKNAQRKTEQQLPEGSKPATPTPGQGTLPPVPDQAEAVPLSSVDAAQHLDRAWQRIREDWTQHRRAQHRSVASGVKDW